MSGGEEVVGVVWEEVVVDEGIGGSWWLYAILRPVGPVDRGFRDCASDSHWQHQSHEITLGLLLLILATTIIQDHALYAQFLSLSQRLSNLT